MRKVAPACAAPLLTLNRQNGPKFAGKEAPGSIWAAGHQAEGMQQAAQPTWSGTKVKVLAANQAVTLYMPCWLSRCSSRRSLSQITAAVKLGVKDKIASANHKQAARSLTPVARDLFNLRGRDWWRRAFSEKGCVQRVWNMPGQLCWHLLAACSRSQGHSLEVNQTGKDCHERVLQEQGAAENECAAAHTRFQRSAP